MLKESKRFGPLHVRHTRCQLLLLYYYSIPESVEQFVNEKIVKLFGLASAFNKTLKRQVLEFQIRDTISNLLSVLLQYNTTLLSLCREISFLACHLHKNIQ